MEYEPIFNFEHDPLKPEVKAEKDDDDIESEKSKKKKKSRIWDRPDKADKEATDADGKKVKRAGEGLLGLAKEVKAEEDKEATTKKAGDLGSTLVAPEMDVDTTSSVEHASDGVTHLPTAEAIVDAPIYQRSESDTGQSTDTAVEMVEPDAFMEEELVDAEIVGDGLNAEATVETNDVVDAEIINTPENNDEKLASLPGTTTSTAPFVFARTRATQPDHEESDAAFRARRESNDFVGNVSPPYAESIPVPAPVETDPLTHRNNRKSSSTAGLAAGAAAGWLAGQAGSKKSAETDKTTRVEQPRAWEQPSANNPTPIETEPAVSTIDAAHAKPPVSENLGNAVTVNSEQLPNEKLEPIVNTHLRPEAPAIERAPIAVADAENVAAVQDKKHEQAVGIEADSKFREDAHEKLDQPQDQGGFSGGAADPLVPGVPAHAVSHHIGPAVAHDPVARSVTQARKHAQVASKRASTRAHVEIAFAIGGVLVVIAWVAWFVLK